MIYNYCCDHCGHSSDISHSMSDEPVIKCSSCGETMRKFITGGIGTVLKGGGWSSDSKMKNDLTKKNAQAGKKMKDHQQPVRSLDDLKRLKGSL